MLIKNEYDSRDLDMNVADLGCNVRAVMSCPGSRLSLNQSCDNDGHISCSRVMFTVWLDSVTLISMYSMLGFSFEERIISSSDEHYLDYSLILCKTGVTRRVSNRLLLFVVPLSVIYLFNILTNWFYNLGVHCRHFYNYLYHYKEKLVVINRNEKSGFNSWIGFPWWLVKFPLWIKT